MSYAADLRRLSDALVSRRCGIVTSLSPQPRGPEEPCPPYIWNATLSHFGFQQYPLAMRLVGLGCDIDPVVAVDKSVFELCQLRSGMRTRMQNNSYKSRLGNIEAVRTLDDHALFHTMPEHAAAFEFLTQSGAECDLHTLPKPDCETPEATLGHIVNTAVKTGARVAYADITPSDIRPLGPRVVRVIITGMQPIDFGFAQGRLGGARLYKAPVDWGYRTEPLTESELNQCPHPLA